MKNIKYIIISLLALILLLLLIGLLLPNRYEITASATIDRSPEVAYFHALDFPNRALWDPWIETDPDAKTTAHITEEGVGSSWQWDGEKVGKGQLIVHSLKVHEQIQSNLVFEGSEQDTATMIWDFIPKNQGTHLRWTMKGKWGNPFARWIGVFIKPSIRKSFERGLNNFKNYLEKMPSIAGSTHNIRLEDTQAVKALIVETQAGMENISQAIGTAYSKLMEYFGARGITPTGPPFTRYQGHYETGQPIRFEAGFPVRQNYEGQGEVVYREYPASKAVTALHRGPYSSLYLTYNNVLKYINDHNLTPSGPMWESYLTDPMAEPDSNRWETMFYQPVR